MSFPAARIAKGAFFLFLLSPAFSPAQTYETLTSSHFAIGNSWLFDTVSIDSLGQQFFFATTWEMVRTEKVNGINTVVLRESAPSYVDEWNVALDNTAMTMYRINEVLLTNPLQHYQTTFLEPLEKIPHLVNSSDAARAFGHGQATTVYVEDPIQQWTRTQDQKVTFLGLETVTVIAGTFACVKFRVEESWQYTNGWSGTAQRYYWINHLVGPVAMDYFVQDVAPDSRVFNSSTTQRLRAFTTAVPDLAASLMSFAPNPAASGGNLTVNWREDSYYKNSGAHSSDVFLSTDTVITQRDFRLLRRNIPALNVGTFVNASQAGQIPANFPGGMYYVGIVVDSLNQVAELDEYNSYTLPTQLTIVSQPDLAVTAVSFSPAVLSPGGALNVKGTVTNIGGGPASACWTHVYLSPDRVITTSDYPLISGIQTPALGIGEQAPFDRNAIVPLGFPNGVYYVGVLTDVLNSVNEVDETNNTSVPAQTLLIGQPDLAATGGFFVPTATTPGRAISIQATVQNIGPITAGANWTNLYLSPDSVITTGDVLLQSVRLPALTSGSVMTINANPVIPTGTALGNYRIGIMADVGREVVEANEFNNVLALPGTLRITTPPDLRADYFDFAPVAVNSGGGIALAGWVTNSGGMATTGTGWVEFYVSPNGDLSPPRYFLCQSVRLPVMASGQRFYLNSIQATVTTGVPAGIYTVGLIIDRVNEISEATKANNTAIVSARKIRINGPPTTGASRWQLYR